MARRFEPVSLGSATFTRLEAGAFQITRARFPQGLELPTHVHERACVAVTLGGGWDSVLGGRSHACAPGTLLVEPAGDAHSNRFTTDTDVLVLQPDSARTDLVRPCARLLYQAASVPWPLAVPVAGRIATELTAPDDVTPLVVEGLALELVATAARIEAGRRGAGRPRWILRARERLHDGAVAGLTVSQLAGELGVHPVHLARVFRGYFGVSPGTYARRIRVERATQYLVSGDDSLAGIAHASGFADQSHFTREFRRLTGLTPGAFRRLRRTRDPVPTA